MAPGKLAVPRNGGIKIPEPAQGQRGGGHSACPRIFGQPGLGELKSRMPARRR